MSEQLVNSANTIMSGRDAVPTKPVLGVVASAPTTPKPEIAATTVKTTPVPTKGVTTATVEIKYYTHDVAGKSAPIFLNPPTPYKRCSWAESIRLYPSNQEIWTPNGDTPMNGALASTLYSQTIPTLPLIDPQTGKQFINSDGKSLWIADRTSEAGLVYLFWLVKAKNSGRSDVECLADSYIEYDISGPAYQNRFAPALRQGNTYGSYWEIIALEETRGNHTAQDIVTACASKASSTSAEIAQHSYDITRTTNNIIMGTFVAAAAIATLGVSLLVSPAAGGAAAASGAAVTGGAGAVGGVAAPAGISVTVLEGGAAASIPVITAPSLGALATAGLGVLVTAGSQKINEAVSALLHPPGQSDGAADDEHKAAIIAKTPAVTATTPSANPILAIAAAGVGFVVFGIPGAIVAGVAGLFISNRKAA